MRCGRLARARARVFDGPTVSASAAAAGATSRERRAELPPPTDCCFSAIGPAGRSFLLSTPYFYIARGPAPPYAYVAIHFAQQDGAQTRSERKAEAGAKEPLDSNERQVFTHGLIVTLRTKRVARRMYVYSTQYEYIIGCA